MQSQRISTQECLYIINIEEMENLIDKYKNKKYIANLQLNFTNGLSVIDKLQLPDKQLLKEQNCSLCNYNSQYAIINSSIPNDIWKWTCEDHFDYFYDNAKDSPIIILSHEKFEIHNIELL